MLSVIKKLISVLFLVAVCASFGSCRLVKKSGKPYINKKSNAADGISYWTEENETDHFIAIKREEETILVPVNEEKYGYYKTDGLCKVKPGEIYTITYDAQHVTGGIDGRNNIYFLAVYKCENCSYDELFENGCYTGFLYPLSGSLKGGSFLAFEGEDGGYDVYGEWFGKRHYDERREVRFPLEFSDVESPIEMQFNVYCNSDVTDDFIIDTIMQRKLDEQDLFVFIDANHPGEYNDGTDYDSIEKAAFPGYDFNSIHRIHTDKISDEDYREFITGEDLSNKSAEELGLDEEIYDEIKSYWTPGYDAILQGGKFYDNNYAAYDKDLKIYAFSHKWDVNTQYSTCVVIFVRSGFNEIFPQD